MSVGAPSTPWKMLSVVSLAQFLGMTLWFSATAVTPLLIEEFDIAPNRAAWLTMAVQAGFVAGTLVSALSNVADMLNARVLNLTGPTTWSTLDGSRKTLLELAAMKLPVKTKFVTRVGG